MQSIRYLFALLGLACALAKLGLEWHVLERSQLTLDSARALTHPYSSRGLVVYVSETEGLALKWLFPAGGVFVFASIALVRSRTK